MLSLAKLAGSDQRYYLEQAHRQVDHTESVSTGAEDYYLSGPEASGRWMGSAARRLGLNGEVSEAALRAVLSKHDPRTGQLLEGSVQRARMPGFDLMFSVPKSASVVFGVGGTDAQRAIRDAQAAAVRAALTYLEERACRTRRGAGGCEILPGEGFVGAAFRHRTSRAGDPQIHTHVLIANATRIEDGTWGSLDGRAIYAEARTAGFIHEAVFRRELSLRLGVEWSEARNGIGEVEGVPRAVITAFSRRKAEIDERVAAWGRDTAAARQSAAVQTRARKDYGVTPERLAPEWRERAVRLGLDAARLRTVLDRRRRRGVEPLGEAQARLMASADGLTAHQSSFDRRDVIRAAAAHARGGASRVEIEAFADRFLARPDVVPLAEPGGLLRREDVIRRRDGRLVAAMAASPRYSTTELLGVEQRVLTQAVAGTEAGAGLAQPRAVADALAQRPTMGDDQAEMVRRLCRGGEAIQVVVGPPGTGKTFALAAAREAWQTSGFSVYGAAVARRAAAELTATAGIDATSVAALLTELRHGHGLLDRKSILVVDEAAMLGTRPLSEIAESTRAAGAKLVLVGDHAQLPEIEAGGAFRALAARTSPIVLEFNRRQERARDRHLLDLWRSGQLRSALTVATEAGDVVLDASPEEAVRRLVDDYCSAVAAGEDAIMLAPRRAEVRRLNDVARERLATGGHAEGPSLEVGGSRLGRGGRVVLRRNAPELGVQNGTRGTITSVDEDAQALTIALADGTERRLPSRYVHLPTSRGGAAVEHGYALTAHLAQGMTTDRAFVLGSETVYREWGYVAWSRARRGTRFYVVEPEPMEEHHTAASPPVDRFDEAVRRLDRSEAQRIAMDGAVFPPAGGAAAAAKHSRVAHLQIAIGPRPESFLRRRRWDRAARRIEQFRSRHGVTDPLTALGPVPAARIERVMWQKAARELDRARRGLGVAVSREGHGQAIGL